MSLMEHKGLKVEDAYIIHYAGAWGKGEEWVLNEMRKYQ
jgi:D-arabinose 5-phosphate isomerase GutQ